MLKAKARQCWPREQSTRDAKQLRASRLCARHKSQLSSERPTHCEPSPLLLSLYGKGFPKVKATSDTLKREGLSVARLQRKKN